MLTVDRVWFALLVGYGTFTAIAVVGLVMRGNWFALGWVLTATCWCFTAHIWRRQAVRCQRARLARYVEQSDTHLS